jgi:CRISPR-associated protein Cmx8
MAKKAAPEFVDIPYNLIDLPTAQHKAGLAGLIVAIRSLKERSDKDPEAIPPATVPEILEGPHETTVKIRFTERSLQGILHDTYDVNVEETEPEEKQRKRSRGRVIVTPIRTTMETRTDRRGNTIQVEQYVYLRFRPRFPALEGKLPNDDWFKLWQDLILGVIRDIDKKKQPYKRQALRRCKNTTWEACATSQYSKLDSEDDDDVDLITDLHDLQQVEARAYRPIKISGSLWIGAQEKNAERVEFLV